MLCHQLCTSCSAPSANSCSTLPCELTGGLVTQPPHKVDLTNPKKTVLVEVMKATAAISVVDDYKSLGKLNFRELSLVGDEDDAADKTDAKQDAAAAEDQPPAAGAATTDATDAAAKTTEPEAATKQQDVDS